MKWSELNNIQLGKYAEYFTKMEFTKQKQFIVFTAEVDDRGIDFVIRYEDPETDEVKYLDIQVKSYREGKSNYVFIPKSKFYQINTFFVALVRFVEDQLPGLYLIPANAWLTPNELFRDRNYEKEGQTSKPEYGLNISKRNDHLLNDYQFDLMIKRISGTDDKPGSSDLSSLKKFPPPSYSRSGLKLHEAMEVILKECPNRTASFQFLSDEIWRLGLYTQKSGDKAPPGQIRLRARNYPQFEIIGRQVKLIKYRQG